MDLKEWQPIETAPKDGLWFLITNMKRYGAIDNSGHDIYGEAVWKAEDDEWWYDDLNRENGWVSKLSDVATHWYRLPKLMEEANDCKN